MTNQSSLKFVLAMGAVIALTFSFSADAEAQRRGFRIGNAIQMGGGQGVRIGGPYRGIHLGGGQGVSMGGMNTGMRFGNGQGARIGGANYGMQFGGGQGTQIGQFQTMPMTQPGTYYYGDVQNMGYAQPVMQQPMMQQQPMVVTNPAPMMNNVPNYASQASVNVPMNQMQMVAPAVGSELVAPGMNTGIAQQPAFADEAMSMVNSDSNGQIRLTYPADAKETLNYKLNGTEFQLEPGKSVVMDSSQEWSLVFPAGGEMGDREAKLTEAGNFVFSQSESEGWILNRDESTAVETQVVNPIDAVPDPEAMLDSDNGAIGNTLIDDVKPADAPNVDLGDIESAGDIEPAVEPTDEGAEAPGEDG